jgi:hypothetical protein
MENQKKRKGKIKNKPEMENQKKRKGKRNEKKEKKTL